MQKMEIKVSPDKLGAYLILHLDEGEKLTEKAIYDALKEAGITYGVKEEVVSTVVNTGINDESYLVAEGVAPTPPVDGKVVYKFKIQRDVKDILKKIGEEDKIDFRSLSPLVTCKKGDVLAELIPPKEGRSGMDVYGSEIPPKKGKIPTVHLGRNVQMSENELKVISTANGIPRFLDGEKIAVEELFLIKGNVDYSTGNVDFDGDVHITGDVKPEFLVKASGNILIDGIIDGATVISGGDITVMGIKGRDKGIVKSKGSIRAHYIESALIEADKDVIVNGSIINSSVKCKSSFQAIGRMGDIKGGVIEAGDEVIATRIGSEIGVKTEIMVGVHPELKEQLTVVNAQLQLDMENLQKIAMILKELTRIKKAHNGKLPEDKEQMLQRTIKTAKELRGKVAQLKNKKTGLLKIFESVGKNARVIAKDMLYRGVEITIKNLKYYASKNIKKVEIRIEKGSIVLKGYASK